MSRKRRGSVLIAIVWAILSLSLLAAALGADIAGALERTSRLEQRLQAVAIARTAIETAVGVLHEDATLYSDSLGEEWADNPLYFDRQRVGEGLFSIIGAPAGAAEADRHGLQDEDGHMNLNTAPKEWLIRLGMQAGGLPERDAEVLADSILDWRDEDSDTQPYGAEGDYYAGQSGGYACKNAPFEQAEELLLIRGVRPEVFARLAPWITVYGSGAVNLNTAPVPVLRAMGLSDTGVNGLVFFRAGADNTEGTMDDLAISNAAAIAAELGGVVPTDDVAELVRAAGEDLVGVGSEAFRLRVEARAQQEAMPTTVECVISRAGEILEWTER